MKAVVLLSGGIDSVTALYHAHREGASLSALSFDYGSKHNHREIPMARWHCDALGIPHRVCELDFVAKAFRSDLLKSGDEIPEGHYQEESMRQTVVPFRNGIMLAICAGYAESTGADSMIIAAHSGDHAIYPDCRPQFMEAMSAAIALGTYAKVGIERPFISMTKAEIVARGHLLGIDYTRTWSCYKGTDTHCGACGTCVERREAFELAGIPDPTTYGTPPKSPN